ncbi:phosphotransferase family protein [Methanoculleus frigidifontis]|nr:aminoglycoside phosphotransferase family protein [Methanoculleus sp. FWC-SCC1]
MEPFERIRKEVHEITGFLHAEEIREGYSDERKYVLGLQGGERLLLRITKPADEAIVRRKQAEFDVIRDLGHYSDKIPEAEYFGVSKENRLCFMILRFIEGTAAEKCLPDLPGDVQYAIGVAAGEELKKMHAMKAPAWYPGWYETKTQKHAYYLRSLAECGAKPEGVDLDAIQTYVESGMDLMKNVEAAFQHDDYHPGNIIVRDGSLSGVIDFNRYDWGDPIHDFYKTAFFSRNVSIPFSVGQIDGYTGGNVPNDFWKKYSLYVAMGVVADTVWSHRYAIRTGAAGEVERSQKTVQTIWRDHDGFDSDVPLWYHEFRESRDE